jgi:Lar family restriction alleviation protein
MFAPHPKEPEADLCPFCGADLLAVIEADIDSFAVNCKHCGGIGPIGSDTAAAIRLWNTRARVGEELASIASG